MSYNIKQGFISVFTSKIGGTVLTVVITPFLVRALGSELYGKYAFLLSVAAIVMAFVGSGIFDGVRKFIAEDRHNQRWVESICAFYTQLSLFLYLIIFIAISVISEFDTALSLFNIDERMYLFFLGGVIVSRQMSSTTRSMLHGLHLEHIGEPLKIVKIAIFALIGIPLAYFGFGLVGVLFGEIVGELVVVIANFYYIQRKVNFWSLFHVPSLSITFRELLIFNNNSVILNLFFMSLYYLDVLMLTVFVPSQEVGYYKASLMVAEFLWFGSLALQVVLLHSTSSLWNENKTSQISDLASNVTRYNLIFTCLLTIGLFVLADDFIPIYYGEEFNSSVTPLLFLLPGVLGYGLARPMISISQGNGKFKILIVTTAIAAAINIVLNVWLIPKLGINGAAIATSIGYFSMLLLSVFSSFRVGFNPVNDLRVFKIAICVVTTILILTILDMIIASNLLSLIIIPFVGLVVYFTIVIYTGAIKTSEIRHHLDSLPAPLQQMFIYFLDKTDRL